MEQIRKVWEALSWGQRIGIAAAVLLLVGGLTSFTHWRHESNFRPLFTSMTPEDAASIMQRLKESGVEHRIGENGSAVLVPAAKVDELRIELAGAGLPHSGRIGFELFDKTNLGITDFSEHVNYRRALEGELERSVRVLKEIEQARIHLSFPKDSVFLDSREPAKASVLVSLRAGNRLSDSNVLAITNLVASAVEGLSPEFVSVVDGRGNLLSRPRRSSPDASDGSDATLEFKHQVEKDFSSKVVSTLSPLLGEDHFRFGISADCDFSTSEQTDETFDPSRSVMTNSQKSEDLANKPDSAGIPGTPSNTPRPISRPTMAGSTVSHKTENLAYQTSRSVRQVKTPRGIVKRLSASILMDQEVHWEGKGTRAKRVVAPPSPEKVKAIHDLVAGLIGFSQTRGDQLVIETLPFEQKDTFDSDSSNVAKPAASKEDLKQLIRDPKILIGAGAAVLLVTALLLLTMMGKKKQRALKQAEDSRMAALESGKKAAADEQNALAGAEKVQLAAANSESALALVEKTPELEKLRESIRAGINRDPVLAAGVIRSWLAEAEA